MKIERIDSYYLECPIEEPFGWSQGWANQRTALICKLTTDDGTVGWGEGGGLPSQAVIHELFAPQLLKADPSGISRLWHQLFQSLHNDNLTGGFGGGALSAIDIALWDLAGQASNQSISELLGGAVRIKVPVYATGLYYRENETETLIQEALMYAEAGFGGMKTKVGGLSVDQDVERVRRIREAIGSDIYLMVDANKAYDVATAIRMGNRLADLDIHWFEEPVLANDVDGYLKVVDGQSIAVAGGEVWYNRFDARDFLAKRALHIAQPDVRFIGGISEFRNVSMMANAMGIQVCPHVWGSPIMISASISLASTLPPCPYARVPRPYEQEPVMEFDQTPNPLRNELASVVFDQVDGYVNVPTGPGLGLAIDESVLRRFCISHVSSR